MKFVSGGFLQLDSTAKVRVDEDPLFLYLIGISENLSERFVEVDLAKGYSLRPGRYLYGNSFTSISVPDHQVGLINPLSALAELGLIFLGSTVLRPGFSGEFGFGLYNASEVVVEIPPYYKVAEICFLG